MSLILVLMLSSAASDISMFRGERLEFDLFYKGVRTATARMWLEAGDSRTTIVWSVESRPLVTLLFKIDNRYEAVLEGGMLVQANKVIDQKNIQQQLTIDYDRESLQARANANHTWPILHDCHHILSMLYDLRTRSLTTGDSVHYVVDVEGQLWRLSGRVESNRDHTDNIAAHEIEFHFSPALQIRERPWKTDLLTNRLAREHATLFIQLGIRQQPSLIRFGGDKTAVEMRLVK
ncbi:DUF3108 domain-containing protein [candidate division KSB1 bacterium]|nr:DUF3108 domain-containing protein [candidate division KSB1 bacterium]